MGRATSHEIAEYRTAVEESVHALASLHGGHSILSIDINPDDDAMSGQTIIAWTHGPSELRDIFKADVQAAEALAKSAIAAITSPSWHLQERINTHDAAVREQWEARWPAAGRPWMALACEAAQETMPWLRLASTRESIRKLTVDVLVHRQLEGAALQRILGKYHVTPQPKPQQAALPQRTPAVAKPVQPQPTPQRVWVTEYGYSLYAAYANYKQYPDGWRVFKDGSREYHEEYLSDYVKLPSGQVTRDRYPERRPMARAAAIPRQSTFRKPDTRWQGAPLGVTKIMARNST